STGIEESGAASFTEETGIPVEFDLTDYGELQSSIRRALQADQRPPVDLMYTVAIFAEQAKLEGLLTPLDPEIVTHLADLTAAGLPQDGGSDYVNVYSYTFPVIYDADAITPS